MQAFRPPIGLYRNPSKLDVGRVEASVLIDQFFEDHLGFGVRAESWPMHAADSMPVFTICEWRGVNRAPVWRPSIQIWTGFGRANTVWTICRPQSRGLRQETPNNDTHAGLNATQRVPVRFSTAEFRSSFSMIR